MCRSTRWLQRKATDRYTRLAHEEGYVARAAYKLQQILQSNRRIRARTIVDLGASPGGWTQVALRRFKGSKIVSIDLKPLQIDERGCTSLILDFLSPGAEDTVISALGGRQADLVMSDMAPSYCGQRSIDHMRLMELSNKALTFAKKVLRPGGSFICKASTGGEEPLFKKRLQKLFEDVKFIKPDSSFKDSTEIFVVAFNYLKVKQPEPAEEPQTESPETSAPLATPAVDSTSPNVESNPREPENTAAEPPAAPQQGVEAPPAAPATRPRAAAPRAAPQKPKLKKIKVDYTPKKLSRKEYLRNTSKDST